MLKSNNQLTIKPMSTSDRLAYLTTERVVQKIEDGEGALAQTELAARLRQLVPVYQNAFGGDLWQERSACPDACPVGGFCSSHVGEKCETSGLVPEHEAYPEDQLMDTFMSRLDNGALFAVEYISHNDAEVPAVASIMWPSTAEALAEDKYSNLPDVAEWLQQKLGSRKFIYRDEVFADFSVRQRGNLECYGEVSRFAAEHFGLDLLVGRTINVKVLGKLYSAFGNQLEIYAPNMKNDINQDILRRDVQERVCGVVPDWRYVAIIDLTKEA